MYRLHCIGCIACSLCVCLTMTGGAVHLPTLCCGAALGGRSVENFFLIRVLGLPVWPSCALVFADKRAACGTVSASFAGEVGASARDEVWLEHMHIELCLRAGGWVSHCAVMQRADGRGMTHVQHAMRTRSRAVGSKDGLLSQAVTYIGGLMHTCDGRFCYVQ